MIVERNEGKDCRERGAAVENRRHRFVEIQELCSAKLGDLGSSKRRQLIHCASIHNNDIGSHL